MMWRNFEEDWERKKTYLIRSLFHDIPLLSPVPEAQETRSDLGSPSDVPPSRPQSPLPPLIIERIPNRHDHPDQYYKELEIKIKKIYRKLFCNEKSSSIDDLLDLYGGDSDMQCFISNQEDDVSEKSVPVIVETGSTDSNHNFDDVIITKTVSSENLSPQSIGENRSVDLSDSIISTQSEENSIATTKESRRSTESEGAIHITAEVMVHRECYVYETEASVTQDPIDEEMQRIHGSTQEDLELSLVYGEGDNSYSPILGAKNRSKYLSMTAETEISSSYHDNTQSGNSSSTGSSGKAPQQEDKINGISASDITLEGIEIMRRQKGVSPSLGSLQAEHLECTNSTISYDNIVTRKRPSLEIVSDSESSKEEGTRATDILFSFELPHDFREILTTSTPRSTKSTSLSTSAESGKRRRVQQLACNTHLLTKKSRYENIAIQTENKDTCWDTLRKDFFVGDPKIFKLCSCKDHRC